MLGHLRGCTHRVGIAYGSRRLYRAGQAKDSHLQTQATSNSMKNKRQFDTCDACSTIGLWLVTAAQVRVRSASTKGHSKVNMGSPTHCLIILCKQSPTPYTTGDKTTVRGQGTGSNDTVICKDGGFESSMTQEVCMKKKASLSNIDSNANITSLWISGSTAYKIVGIECKKKLSCCT